MQTFRIVICYCALGISLESRSVATETLGSHNIRQKMDECREPGPTKGGIVVVILPSYSCAWRLRSGSFGAPSRVNRVFAL